MGTYVSTATTPITEDGAYVSASRHGRTRSTGYVSGARRTDKTGAYVCSNLK